MMRIVREALRATTRSPLLSELSVITIAFSLFAFGLFGLVALNIRETLSAIEERVEIRAFIAEGTAIEAVSAVLGDAQAFPEVQSATLVTAEEALQRARRELGEFSDIFDAAILPASIDVRLREGFRTPDAVQGVAERLGTYPFIDDVRYGEEWVEKLYRLRSIAGVAGSILGGTFAAVALIIIGSTIRMAVLARSREIEIMRLVGATDGFIRAPFLLDGFLKGLIGGAVAVGLTWIAHRAISEWVVASAFFPTSLVLAGIGVGGLLGLLGSALSVGRHLREQS
jgi:cell division transport system permease protein